MSYKATSQVTEGARLTESGESEVAEIGLVATSEELPIIPSGWVVREVSGSQGPGATSLPFPVPGRCPAGLAARAPLLPLSAVQ